MIRVLVIEDHTILRSTLVERLEREQTISVVGAVGTADQALELVAQHQPDIILSDIDMPGKRCFDVIREIVSAHPEVRLIFLSAFTYDHYIEEALAVGAMGYLTKGEPPEKIIEAINAVTQDRSRFSAEVCDRIIVDEKGLRKLKGTTRLSLLTQREREVLRYIAEGLAKKEIAALLHVSVNTIDKHTTNLMNKLDIHDRVGLARFAIQEHIATL